MTKIEDLIAKLPPELQPIAGRYISLFLQSGQAELAAWINMLLSGDWLAAYSYATSKMTTEDLIAEQQRINDELSRLNTENAANVAAQKALIQQALTIAIGLLQVSVGL